MAARRTATKAALAGLAVGVALAAGDSGSSADLAAVGGSADSVACTASDAEGPVASAVASSPGAPAQEVRARAAAIPRPRITDTRCGIAISGCVSSGDAGAVEKGAVAGAGDTRRCLRLHNVLAARIRWAMPKNRAAGR